VPLAFSVVNKVPCGGFVSAWKALDRRKRRLLDRAGDAPKDWTNPVIAKGTDTHICFHWDNTIRRYVVYLRGRPNVRVITMAESEDCVEWTERELIVAPDELDPPQDHEFYGMSPSPPRDPGLQELFSGPHKYLLVWMEPHRNCSGGPPPAPAAIDPRKIPI
jgi:hypothetical protein